MVCDRVGCDNILCDTYVCGVGYICDSCQSEFKDYLRRNDLNPKTEKTIILELKKFINIPKEMVIYDREISVDDFDYIIPTLWVI